METLKLKIKRLEKEAKLPTSGNERAACFDIYAYIKEGVLNISPFETVYVKTGFATQIPEGYWAPIYARSGIATKRGLRLAQGTAVIDEDYRGEWLIPIHNDTEKMQSIENGERICQFNLQKKYLTEIEEVEELDETERGTGGFGSTGIK